MTARKCVAAVQSNYIPWKGYFDLINTVDEFILLDELQYTRRDWRNRNRIKTAGGTIWLTIPVQVSGRYTQRIDETLVSDSDWAARHWKTIEQAYAKAPHFDAVAARFAPLYAALDDPHLSAINRRLIEAACAALGIDTPLTWSSQYAVDGRKTERLVNLCLASGATEYLSGPAARAYLDEERFAEHGIGVRWMDYGGYPGYPQLHGEFDHFVSVLDLLFCTGEEAPQHMRSFDYAAG
ncbi:MAG TPA: WbqC family protein [Thermoleophilaceae bacterium]|jgi:hypothetical protein